MGKGQRVHNLTFHQADPGYSYHDFLMFLPFIRAL